jgi:transcription antitermination factor NusG
VKKLAHVAWYLLRSKPGEEELAKKAIEHMAKKLNLSSFIHDIIIPTGMAETERRKPGRGKQHVTDTRMQKRKLAPGMLMMRADLTEPVYNFISGALGVVLAGGVQFAGANSSGARKPFRSIEPMKEEQVRAFLGADFKQKEVTEQQVRQYLSTLPTHGGKDISLDEPGKVTLPGMPTKRKPFHVTTDEIQRAIAGEPTSIDMDAVREWVNQDRMMEPNDSLSRRVVEPNETVKITAGHYAGRTGTVVKVAPGELDFAVVQVYAGSTGKYVKVPFGQLEVVGV